MRNLTEISKMIDHSLLHPTYTDEFLQTECRLAREYDVAAVCIKPYAIGLAKDILAGSTVKVSTVVGFPGGGSSIEIKVKEAASACRQGAVEIDFVINIGKVLSRDWKYVSEEIAAINNTVVSHKAISKVIFENDFYEDNEYKIKLCQICNQHRVAFVKTSTGYGFVRQKNGMYSYKGATDEDLILMRKYCITGIQIKAAGGIQNLADVLRVKALGVTRIGATRTKQIIDEAIRKGYTD